ncbi:hypothetical protein HID58_092231 [Brassica napus]|uniref:Uncharacterized protein n=1 Tax=Brassica napus TaxID=3708 RepID=A0ABQ7WX49_BRANA|nr:hypothetical protein HID58_092231 [Brassica napus]
MVPLLENSFSLSTAEPWLSVEGLFPLLQVLASMGSWRTVPPCSLQVMMLEPRSHSDSPVFEVSTDFSRSSSPSQCSGMLLLTDLLSALNLWVAPPQLAPDWVLPALRRRSLRESPGLSSAFQHRFSLLFDA